MKTILLLLKTPVCKLGQQCDETKHTVLYEITYPYTNSAPTKLLMHSVPILWQFAHGTVYHDAEYVYTFILNMLLCILMLSMCSPIICNLVVGCGFSTHQWKHLTLVYSDTKYPILWLHTLTNRHIVLYGDAEDPDVKEQVTLYNDAEYHKLVTSWTPFPAHLFDRWHHLRS